MSASDVIAILALLVSGLALWRSQLAPGRIETTAGPLRLRVYPYDRGGERWVVPEAHLSIAFTNLGARPVIVDSVRMILRHREVGSGDGRETFFPILTLREPMGTGYDSHDDRDRRFAEESEWMPALVPSKKTLIQHVVLHSQGWDAPPMGRADAMLEVKVRDKPWEEVERYSLDLRRPYWHHIYGGMAVPGVPDSAPDTGPVLTPDHFEDEVAAQALDAFGQDWWHELQKRSQQRDRDAAKARGETYQDRWHERLK